MSENHSISIIDGNPSVLWVPGKLQTKKLASKPKSALTPDIPPSEMFKRNKEYTLFDLNGIPTHDKNGKPLSVTKLKKLHRQYETHKAIHDKWLSQKHTKSFVCCYHFAFDYPVILLFFLDSVFNYLIKECSCSVFYCFLLIIAMQLWVST